MSTSTIKSSQKKEWAKLLYCKESLTQKEIAQRVSISEQTLCKWIKQEKWEMLKASLTVTRQEQLMRFYMQIAAINKDISENKKGIPDNSDTDKIIKLSSTIEKLEKECSIADVISVSMKVLDFIRKIDVDKAKEMSGFFDSYIKSII